MNKAASRISLSLQHTVCFKKELHHQHCKGNFCRGAVREGAKKMKPLFFPVVPCVRQRGNGHKLEHRRFPLNTRQHFFSLCSLKTGTGCPEELCEPLPWRSPKAAWTWVWAPYCGCPCWAGVGPGGPRGPFQPQPFNESVPCHKPV